MLFGFGKDRKDGRGGRDDEVENRRVIEWVYSEPDELIYRWPDTNIPTMSVVIVRPGQAAIFVRDGKVYGVLREGRHVLTSMNIPFLDKLAIIPGGKEIATMFKAEIYFVSLTEHQGYFGGKAYAGNRFPVQYSGTYRYRVEKPEVFLEELAGTNVDVDGAFITDFLRSTIQSRLLKFIGDLPPKDFTEVLQVQNKAKAFLTTQFEQIGLKLIDLNFSQLTLPPEFERLLPYFSSAETWEQFYQILQMQTLQDMSKNVGSEAGVGMGFGMGMMLPYMFPQPPQFAQAQSAQPAPQMKVCPNCKTQVPQNARFCPNCGYRFEESENKGTICPKCNATVPAGAKFCPFCGTKL